MPETGPRVSADPRSPAIKPEAAFGAVDLRAVHNRRNARLRSRVQLISEYQVIDSHFPLEEIVAAFRHQESGRHYGKIVLDI